MQAKSRRWELTEAERARLDAVRARSISPRDVARIAVSSPRVLVEIVKEAAEGMVDAVWANSSIVWLIDAERTRQAVPEAASGAGWVDERPFLSVLLPLLSPEQRVLDLGSGAGRNARHVAPLVASVICADVSETLLTEAREMLSDHANVRFVRTGKTLRDGVEESSVDLVYAQGVFSYLDVNPLLAMLDDVRHVLVPGGLLVFNAFTIDRPEWAERALREVRSSAKRGRFGAGQYRAYTSDHLRSMCVAAGFNVEASSYEGEELYPGGHLACVMVARASSS